MRWNFFARPSWKVIKIPDQTLEWFSKRLPWYFKIPSGNAGWTTELTALGPACIFHPFCHWLINLSPDVSLSPVFFFLYKMFVPARDILEFGLPGNVSLSIMFEIKLIWTHDHFIWDAVFKYIHISQSNKALLLIFLTILTPCWFFKIIIMNPKDSQIRWVRIGRDVMEQLGQQANFLNGKHQHLSCSYGDSKRILNGMQVSSISHDIPFLSSKCFLFSIFSGFIYILTVPFPPRIQTKVKVIGSLSLTLCRGKRAPW